MAQIRCLHTGSVRHHGLTVARLLRQRWLQATLRTGQWMAVSLLDGQIGANGHELKQLHNVTIFFSRAKINIRMSNQRRTKRLMVAISARNRD